MADDTPVVEKKPSPFEPPRFEGPDSEIWQKWNASMEYLGSMGLYIAHSVISLNIPVFTRRLQTAGVAANKYGGIDFLWNPDFFMNLKVSDTAFINAHEAHHVTAGHVYEKMENHRLFNICADIMVNTWLMKQAKFDLSPELYESLWHAAKINMDPDRLLSYANAIDLYEMFMEKKDLAQKVLAQYGGMIAGDLQEGDGGELIDGQADESIEGDPQDKSAGATADEHQDWGPIEKSDVDGVIDKLKERGVTDKGQGYGSGGMFRAFEMADVNFNWESEVLHFIGSKIRTYDSYERPHRRITPGFKDAVIPYLKRKEHYKAVVYADMSGSIGPAEIAQMNGCLAKAPKSVQFEGYSFDTRIYEWDMKSRPRGGGGTSFTAVVKHAESLKDQPDFFVVLTDGYAEEPHPKNPKKWLWVTTDAMIPKCGGRCVKMPRPRQRVRL